MTEHTSYTPPAAARATTPGRRTQTPCCSQRSEPPLWPAWAVCVGMRMHGPEGGGAQQCAPPTRQELERAGIEVSLAEPADTAAARGRKRRAKTDPADAAHLRQLLAGGRLPTSWIPPEQVREMRAILELYKDLRDEHTAWVQRIPATP